MVLIRDNVWLAWALFLTITIAFILNRFLLSKTKSEEALSLLNYDSQNVCPENFFHLQGLSACQPHLTCDQIRSEIFTGELIGQGAVKSVLLGTWQGHQVSVNKLSTVAFADDFHQGLQMLQLLAPSVNVTPLVGVCREDNVFVTQFFPLGSADKLEEILKRDVWKKFDKLSLRFSLCKQYVAILHTLHSHPHGAFVMCDTNSLEKTLTQFLLSDETENELCLILNDVDALPMVDPGKDHLIKCGHKELYGDFVAPEQLWPYEDSEFKDSEMPGYDEKTDIWKVPDVCEAFIGKVKGGSRLRLQLLPVHILCKSEDPAERPTAFELLQAYQNVYTNLKSL